MSMTQNGSSSSAATDQAPFDPQRWVDVGHQEQQLVADLDAKFEKCKRSRWRFERQWYINMSFYFGKQWINWVNASASELGRLYEPPAPPWRVRLVVNRVRPTVRTELSKVMKEKPTCYVTPLSTDDKDLLAAKAGEAIFEFLWDTMNMQKQLWSAQFWRALTGVGFIKDWWDPSAIDGAQDLQGKICTEVITPFHIYVPNTEQEELEAQPYVIHATAKDPQWVADTYNVAVPADTSSGSGVLEQQFLNALGIDSQPRNYVMVKECWIKPCQKYPEGARFTWAGSTILAKSEKWDYSHKEYPFTKFDGIHSGKFYFDSPVTDLIPLQKEYNRTRSQIIEAKNRMAKPQLIAPRGSIDPGKITSEPGLVIQYTPGFTPPTPLAMQNLPAHVIQELDRNLSDMNDLSGQHDISRGGNPTGVTAATALSYLQEQDDTMLAPVINSLEWGVEKIGRHFLCHVKDFWQAEHTVSVLGENNTYEVKRFTMSDIGNNTALKVAAGSAMPRSLAAKQAFIMELGKMQWIGPQQALRFLDMAETGRLYEEAMVDQRQAQRENLRMKDGEDVPVNSWDNHQAHIDEHNLFRKKQEYESCDSESMARFEQHVQLHRSALGLPPEINPEQLQQMQQLHPELAGAGGPPPPGGPPPVPSDSGGAPPPDLPPAPSGDGSSGGAPPA